MKMSLSWVGQGVAPMEKVLWKDATERRLGGPRYVFSPPS